jgi:1,2-diacylglycerol 3-alpha-glucosyltransferase
MTMAPLQLTASARADRAPRPALPEACARNARGDGEVSGDRGIWWPHVAVLFHRFGPYHIARLNCAAQSLCITGVELSRADRTYAWRPTGGCEAFPRHVIAADVDAEPATALIRRMDQVLSTLRPDAVAIPGWSHRGALAALLWCQRRRIAAILMTESTARDAARRPWKEAVKRRIAARFGAALAGGTAHLAYLRELGMPPERVFDGYDVVDNDHFARAADATRESAIQARCRLGLPERYFLASCRFVEKKNLCGLLEGFARYRDRAGPQPWHLVLLGDGQLRPRLLERVAERGLRDLVHLPGFQQYERLPAFYGLAGAFVLASTSEPWGLVVNEAMAAGLPVLVSDRCGCAPDLVVPGVNGYRFDPLDPERLADLLLHVAADGCDRQGLARAGRAIIAEWTPERFAGNLRRAAIAALATPAGGGSVDRLLIRLLMLRRDED